VCRRFCHFKSWVCNAQLSNAIPVSLQQLIGFRESVESPLNKWLLVYSCVTISYPIW
jgi:hypothetical protein